MDFPGKMKPLYAFTCLDVKHIAKIRESMYVHITWISAVDLSYYVLYSWVGGALRKRVNSSVN